MYKTNCSCTGEEQTSVFVRPETCEDVFHEHHKHDHKSNAELVCTAHECHDCNDHTKSCGCDSPKFFFFKLKDKAIDDEVKYVSVQVVELVIASSDILAELCDDTSDDFIVSFYTDPPPKITSSVDFLINIQQLKIPSIA